MDKNKDGMFDFENALLTYNECMDWIMMIIAHSRFKNTWIDTIFISEAKWLDLLEYVKEKMFVENIELSTEQKSEILNCSQWEFDGVLIKKMTFETGKDCEIIFYENNLNN